MRSWAGAVALVAVVAIPAFGQAPGDAFLLRQRAIEEQVRQELNIELPAEQRVDFDWGGWYNFNLMLFDDGIRSRTFRRHDLRLWSSVRLDEGAHEFYGRLRFQFLDFRSGHSYDGRDDDWQLARLDRGFYQFDLRQAMRAYLGEEIDWNVRAKVGRDFVEFGTGYALSLPMDHILLTGEFAGFEIQGLAGRSIRSMDDLDASRPDAGRSKRNFWGIQLKYIELEKHEPFAYFFYNKDQHRGSYPIHLLQKFGYDTWYLGFGSMGELLTNLRYSTEWVFEGGRSYGDRQRWRRDAVDAWAFDVLLEYLMPRPMRPRFSLEYMFASGDPDRRFSPTNSVGGNTRGKDTSFVGFGYRDTGLSFGPRLSNVHIWRAGAAFAPFEHIEALKNLEVGTDWFLYWKNRRSGAVSDPTADRGSGYLGWEMDYFVTWRITSDLALTTRFGTFFPGSSFSDQSTRTFFLTGVTWSF